ncbi:MAG: aspartate--tRNA ligase [Spirochaetales bacterium]|nr:aspartate--tRNA ligase [Spirochaetales bacterium]
MQRNLQTRHDARQAAREYMTKNNFLEIETPVLVRATPEGARDYIVPSRTNPGKFYALPQSPQIYKQILMVSGCDRYFQFARCLRDEDLRQDRQPEHTQIDLEMSFVKADDVLEVVEGLHKHMWKKVLNVDIKYKFPRLSYAESMEKYGTDKPDLRFGLELIDVTSITKKSDFQVFNKSEMVKCINPPDKFSRNEIDDLIDFSTKNLGSKGLAWMRVTEKGLESNIVKFFNKDVQKKLLEKTKAKKGSILFFIADKGKTANEILGKLRVELGHRLKLIDKKDFKFCWIVDFPVFAWNEEDNKWTPEHHIFTAPKKEHLKYLDSDPGKVHADLYDLVLNGSEIGGGSIRIHDEEIQNNVFETLGISKEEANNKFGFLLSALKYGAPPHGGIAFGLDRVLQILTEEDSIREVIAFPKNKNASDLMMDSPSPVNEEQLKEVNLKLDMGKKGK